MRHWPRAIAGKQVDTKKTEAPNEVNCIMYKVSNETQIKKTVLCSVQITIVRCIELTENNVTNKEMQNERKILKRKKQCED